jgi:hypothetical protein
VTKCQSGTRDSYVSEMTGSRSEDRVSTRQWHETPSPPDLVRVWAHTASYPTAKVATAWRWPPTSIYCQRYWCMRLYLRSCTRLHGMELTQPFEARGTYMYHLLLQLITLYFAKWVSYASPNKQRLFPWTALNSWYPQHSPRSWNLEVPVFILLKSEARILKKR